MEITSEIINNQIKQLENEKLFKDIEHKNRRAENDRRYYLKNIIGYENYRGCKFNYRVINYPSKNKIR